jgi:hypothetical protein
MSVWRKLYLGWMTIAGRFGGIQTMVILVFFYVFLVGPVAGISRIGRRDYLQKAPLPPGETAWSVADSSPPDLERAKLQT